MRLGRYRFMSQVLPAFVNSELLFKVNFGGQVTLPVGRQATEPFDSTSSPSGLKRAMGPDY